MKHGNQKFRKYIAALFAAATLLLAAGAGLSTVSALAAQTGQQAAELASQANDGNGNVTPPSGEEGKAGSAAGEASSGAESSASSAVSSGSSGTSSPENDLITVAFNLNGGTGMKTVAHLERGTSVSQLKTPVKSGYRFTGWSQGGAILPDSKILDRDMTLTANWKEEPAGEGESTASVDTRQNEVDAAASAAKQAISEPGVLSSQDWNSILSDSSAAASSDSSPQVSSSQASSETQTSGGFSMLLAAGIGLILLGVAGVIVFIYLQFIRRPPGGPGGGSGGRHFRDDDDTMTFTDVSSYSGGQKPDDASAVLYPQTPPKPSAPASGGEQPQTREARRSGPHAASAKTDGNFDWERFFDGAEGR